MSNERRPIWYFNIILTIESGRTYYNASTWYITPNVDSPDELQDLIRSSQDEYERLLYIAFKKRREAILKSKLKKEDVVIEIKNSKQVGFTNGKH
jgi:hypothetical protein